MGITVPFESHRGMKLGKRPRRHDARTLKLARYFSAGLPPAPASVDYTAGITDWGMMLNNEIGCCTIAAVGHAVQAWSVNALGREFTVPDSVIQQYYEKWDGYDPSNPASDQGGVEIDVLNKWHQQGFDGVSLDAYVAVELGNSGLGARGSGPAPTSNSLLSTPIALAIWLFGGAYIGVELPIRAQDQDIWDVPAIPGAADEPGSWGGHAIYLVGYDSGNSGLGTRDSEKTLLLRPQDSVAFANEAKTPTAPSPGTLTCITWGGPKKMTLAWFEKYCSEAYALVSKAWLNSSGVSPSGLNLSAMDADVQLVAA